ncbi:CD109 antigen-like [Saccostrea echinata]|uniref:CD109 antigen-like n=1 Tax=Saccostrea echinata TaxID=191078 RepID=UPI002A806C7B|nr:CD109 antigen-like [Saccostrea echinata]
MFRFLVLLLLGIPVGAKKGSYMLIAPESAIKGDDYPVTVVNNLNESADVTVTMSAKGGAYTTKTGTIAAKSSVKLDMRVTADFSTAFLLNMTLTYTRSDLIIVNSTLVSIKEVSSFLNIQTDKKMYKKNQKVLIRALALDRDLMPVNQNVTIYIKDPDENRVEMWKDVVPESGVAKAEFLLSNDPALGDWTITAEQQHSPSEIVKSVVTFTVDKFVLPRFEVTVIGPPSLYPRSQKPFDVRVIARYTYGENVVGDARILVSMSGSERAIPSKPLIEGTATFTLKPDELKSLLSFYNPVMKVKATVMEGSSRIELEGETTIQLTYDGIKIEIIGDDYYSPDVPYHYCVTVSDDRGQLMPEEDRQNYKVTIVRDWNKTLTRTIVLSSLLVTSSGHLLCETASPPYENDLSLQVTVQKQTDDKTSNTKYITVYKMSNSVNDTAGSLSLMLWEEQQNNLATKDEFNVGDAAKFKVYKSDQSSVDFKVFYQVFSKGMSVTTGMVNFGQSKTAMLSVTVSRWMSPTATVMVYGVSNGYLITAIQKIKVNLNLNSQARMSFGTSRATVGSDVTLRVTTPEQNSFVAVVAIDKGSDLLGTIDITEKEILKGLEMYAMGNNPVNGPIVMNRRKRSIINPYYRSYSTAKILRMVGVMCLTDATIHDEIDSFFDYDSFVKEAAVPEMNDGQPAVLPNQKQMQPNSGSDAKVRKNFPETWIWLDGKSGSDSLFEVQKTLPDSITSWVTRALVVSPTTGLHIPDITQIESFKSFFLVIDTPASIIQGEVFEVKVLVFNYVENGPEELQANVSLKGKIDNTAKIWNEDLDREPASSEGVNKTLLVKRGQSNMFAVWVRKMDTDKFSPLLTLTGKATAESGGQNYMDNLEKVVSAEPEGRRVQKTKVFNLETAGGSDIPPVSIWFPDNAVKGSKSVYVLAMGDLLGQALNNPERMISVPTGCGEQNIATTVPNIYVLQYLRATQAGETKLEARMIKNIKQGYQQELQYKRTDNSFSAFGMSDPAGSTWLTAFVLKSFAEIHRILPDLVDPKVMQGATSWLNNQVGDRGQVSEPGRVIHTEMQGSGANSREKLAAFVLYCYTEVIAEFGSSQDAIYIAASQKMDAIETFLKSNLPSAVTNPYYTSLLTYALAVDGSSTREVSKMAQQLMDNATTFLDGAVEMKCLGENCKGGDSDGGTGRPIPMLRDYQVKEPSPSSIEMTGYLLLTLLKTDRSDDARPFLRWLNSKRNSLGGWYSTQDTVVGLKALSEFVRSQSNNRNIQIDVVITAKQNSEVLKTETIQITPETRLLLQRAEFPIDTTSLEIRPSQAGEAVLSVVWQYNLVNDLIDNDLQVTIGKYTINDNIYDINPCVRYLGSGPSNMALVSVTMGSGMMPDVEKLEQNSKLSKVEVDGSVVHIYLNEVTKESQCMRFRAVQVSKVTDAKEVPVKAMLYYEPEVSAVVSYNPSTSNRVNFCVDQICAHAGHVTPLSLFLVITVSLAAMFFGRHIN